METQEQYETELENVKRDFQEVGKYLERVMTALKRDDIGYAYDQAESYLLDDVHHAIEQLKKLRSLDRELQEEARERYEEAKAGN